jgi:manganese/zinc/iron transport system permease protein
MTWTSLDTWIVLTAMAAAVSCAIPGMFLMLRRQSMLGDAMSHTALPGIVSAFLLAHWWSGAGGTSGAIGHLVVLAGAAIVGVLTTFLTDAVQRLGRVEAAASLGVVYTSLFAAGLLMVRLFADTVHLDADCVLFGAIETVVFETVGATSIPQALVVNLSVALINLLLVGVCFKELRVTTFDPALAQNLGYRPVLVHYVLMAATSVSLVAAFESVGSILVLAMLIVPAVTASLLTSRLSSLLAVATGVAATSAVGGHLLALAAPAVIFRPLGFESVDDSSTAGMAAVAAGALLLIAVLLSPQKGILSATARRVSFGLRMACEDLLGGLYRQQESETARVPQVIPAGWPARFEPLIRRLAIWNLKRQGLVTIAAGHPTLTESGRSAAQQLVRSHRLWESYMARHFTLPDDHLDETAHRVEHFLDDRLLSQLADELEHPEHDPHGRAIPGRNGDDN